MIKVVDCLAARVQLTSVLKVEKWLTEDHRDHPVKVVLRGFQVDLLKVSCISLKSRSHLVIIS